ncbi:MAG TPA: hypothetical protein PKM88_02080 [bacterium]|nr:hypothetical protein [bacterium]
MPDSAPASPASPAMAAAHAISPRFAVTAGIILLVTLGYVLHDWVGWPLRSPSRQASVEVTSSPRPDRSTYYYEQLSRLQIQRLERYDTMLLIPPMEKYQYNSFDAFRVGERIATWSGDSSCSAAVEYSGTGESRQARIILPSGSFIPSGGSQAVSLHSDGSHSTILSGTPQVIGDNRYVGIIWAECGPLTIEKYTDQGKRLFRTQLGWHAHSYGILAKRRGRVFAFDHEAINNSRLLGASLIRVVDWADGREVRKLPVLMTPVTTIALDQGERFLYLVNIQSETTTVSGLKMDLARLP